MTYFELPTLKLFPQMYKQFIFKDQSLMKIQRLTYYFWEGLGNKNCDYIYILKMQRYQNSTNDLFMYLVCECTCYKIK